MTAAQERRDQGFVLFLHLEQQARKAGSGEALAYVMVNDGQPLLGYRHAALVLDGKVRAVTGVTTADPHSPFVAMIERTCRQLGDPARPQVVDAARLDPQTRAEWRELAASEALWVPLQDRAGRAFGGLWYGRDTQWQPADSLLAQQLAEVYAHAWLALEPIRPWRNLKTGWRPWLLCALLGLSLLIPVRQSVLAPAEVVPLGGHTVAAPLDAVVAEFLVQPNQRVKQGDPLVRFDATTLKAQADVAERALGVAEAEYRANAQRAFQDADSNARLDWLAAQVAQKRAERDYARALLERSEIKAERDGIAVFADTERWVGKPVRTGERLMELADPTQAELRIELDVGDAIQLAAGAEVALFLDSDPLRRFQARLERIAYEALPTTAGGLAYRLDARFTEPPPRIGLRGTAKLFGERVPLAVYLFRRPLAALRKTLGL
ncbi:HlyD family efflux transporter periplasmic adaptor subunit [Aeromonas veronii]|nr:HlyD family efflux transporter periplasmic adaptor subunit [Aeromonas veronii]